MSITVTVLCAGISLFQNLTKIDVRVNLKEYSNKKSIFCLVLLLNFMLVEWSITIQSVILLVFVFINEIAD